MARLYALAQDGPYGLVFFLTRMTCVNCYYCEQPVPMGPELRMLTDVRGEWRNLCRSCPELTVTVLQVTHWRPWAVDLGAAAKMDGQEACLCISPQSELPPGLWIVDKTRKPMHQIMGVETDYSNLQDLVFVSVNQDRRTVVWSLPKTHRAEWERFKTNWLSLTAKS